MNKHITIEIFKTQGSYYFYKPRAQRRDTNVQGKNMVRQAKAISHKMAELRK